MSRPTLPMRLTFFQSGYYCPIWRQTCLLGERLTAYAFRVDTAGFDHPRIIDDLTEEPIRRGHSGADIAGILGGNFRRLLGETWK